jgi:hypothetical protein
MAVIWHQQQQAITTEEPHYRHSMPSANRLLSFCEQMLSQVNGPSMFAVTSCVLCVVCWLQGDAGQLIVDIAAKEQADILVLGMLRVGVS